MKKSMAFLLAIVATFLSAMHVSAGWELVEQEFNPDGTVKSGMLVFTNGGEKFDPDKLTWSSIDQWKINLINQQTLTPKTTGHSELDALVQARLDRLLKPDMSNFQKLQAIYNDIVGNCTYSIPIYSTRDGYDPWQVNPPKTYLMSYTDCEYAKYLLNNNAGVCDEFTAAFVAMANAAGFEAYDMAGRINGNGHAWAVINLSGTYYIFDPQAEQVNIKSNHVRYINFGINMAGNTSYVPVEGCLEAQKSYRKVGMAPVSSFITDEFQAVDLKNELIVYSENQGLTYDSFADRRFWETRASEYATKEEMMEKLHYHLREMADWNQRTGYVNILVEPTRNGDGDYIVYIYQ